MLSLTRAIIYLQGVSRFWSRRFLQLAPGSGSETLVQTHQVKMHLKNLFYSWYKKRSLVLQTIIYRPTVRCLHRRLINIIGRSLPLVRLYSFKPIRMKIRDQSETVQRSYNIGQVDEAYPLSISLPLVLETKKYRTFIMHLINRHTHTHQGIPNQTLLVIIYFFYDNKDQIR